MPFATLAEIVRHQAATQPERIALTFAEGDTSYGALDLRANQVANGLIAAGLRPQSRVALLDKNHDSFFEIWFGAAKANVVLVPINWRLAQPEIAFIVNDAEAEILFVGAEFFATVVAHPRSACQCPRDRRYGARLSGMARPAVRCRPRFADCRR
jgi:acyl-CoA synthetase (AMP-forming)/AMP-acid ligase II